MNISNSEMKLMEIIWEKQPITSPELVKAAFAQLGWKKSTVYTVIKSLSNKGALKSEKTVINALCTRDEVIIEKSENLLSRHFSGSLPVFLTTFLQKEKLTRSQAEELKKLIDEYTEDNK